MWAQLIKTGVKDGSEAGVRKLVEPLRAVEQPDSGLVRTLAMRDKADPNSLSPSGGVRERREGAGS